MIIAEQPNGKYCIWDKDGKIHINQTEDDYYNFALDEAKKRFSDPGYMNGIDKIIRQVSDNKLLKQMGFVQPHSELTKYIPELVINQSYNPRDCETVGKCPRCGNFVYNGIGGTDVACKACGQHLMWRGY